jgi:hypothetical protein
MEAQVSQTPVKVQNNEIQFTPINKHNEIQLESNQEN